ncbi:hypothetical protein [Actinomadura scrupuli]
MGAGWERFATSMRVNRTWWLEVLLSEQEPATLVAAAEQARMAEEPM